MTHTRRFAPLGLLLLLSCEDAAAPGINGTLALTLTPNAVLVFAGDDTTLSAEAQDSTGPVAVTVAWTSADPSIASVTAGGLLTGQTPGRTTVYATTAGARDSLPVLVVGSLTGITINPYHGWLHPGTTAQFVAVLHDSLGGTVSWSALPWSSDNALVVAVSEQGLASGIAIGKTNVTATLAGLSGGAIVDVVPPVESVAVFPSRLTMVLGTVISFSATVFDSTGATLTGYPVVWSAGDTAVATILPTGVMTAVANGSTTIRASAPPGVGSAPIAVRMARYVQVEAADGGQACGVSTDSLAFCWGSDGEQFGTGARFGLPTEGPVQVTDSIRFVEIHGGEGYTCGLAVGGAAYCWGFPANGRLGNGVAGGDWPSPVAVLGGHTFVTMGIGHSIACGIEVSADMYCWGRNVHGELGRDPALGPGLTPLLLTGGLSWWRVSPGTLTTCGITTDSTAYCWGLNNYGQVGTGDSTDRWTPTAVTGGRKFISISSASQHTCGVTDTGAAYCWGDNGTGALGDSTQTGSPVPVLVAGGLTFTQVSAGGMHFGADFSCGVAVGGAAYCWGDNFYGELGDGTKTSSSAPVAVTGGLTFATVSAGFNDACGLTTSGITYCWGRTFGIVPLRIAGQP